MPWRETWPMRERLWFVQECRREYFTVVEVPPRIRRRHRDWGPGKIRDYLMGSSPDQLWPARSTIADILRRHGLVKPRRRRPRPGHPGVRGTLPTHPHGLWTADFQGQFRGSR